jgi:hypothetical protein
MIKKVSVVEGGGPDAVHITKGVKITHVDVSTEPRFTEDKWADHPGPSGARTGSARRAKTARF